MTESGDPLENTVAERVNGIIKQEYLDFNEYNDIQEVIEALEKAVNLYNTDRPHLSLGMLKPTLVHENNLAVEKLWRTCYQKNNTIVNPEQNVFEPVNIYQD